VASIFRSALERGEPPRVLEDGRQRRDFVHVTDVAAANALALTADADGFEAVNVCSGEPRTVGGLAHELAARMGGPAPEVVGGPGRATCGTWSPTRPRRGSGSGSRLRCRSPRASPRSPPTRCGSRPSPFG